MNVKAINVDSNFALKETCNTRTYYLKLAIGFLVTIVIGFIALVVYAAEQASAANGNYSISIERINQVRDESSKKIQENTTNLENYKVETKMFQSSVLEKIDEIKTSLKEQRGDQKIILEKILEIQIKIARKDS
jgi:hypothetical protein